MILLNQLYKSYQVSNRNDLFLLDTCYHHCVRYNDMTINGKKQSEYFNDWYNNRSKTWVFFNGLYNKDQTCKY